MSSQLSLEATVTYADVDRREKMLLPRLFKLLQEAAIAHANQYGAGTNAVTLRAETWMLHRIAVEIARYPRAGEKLRIDTWSTGIRAFKGYREFRVFDATGAPLACGSSVWLYFSLRTNSLVRVPREIAAQFPVGSEKPWCPELENKTFELPVPGATVVPVTVRYSDFDVNEHVNNTSYLDFAQTALAATGQNVRPRHTRLEFAKAIPTTASTIEVRLQPADEGARFSVEHDGVVFAVGETGGSASD